MFNEYPYRNLTDLNLDFLLNTIKKVEKEIHEFVTFNALKYADPIQWDITRQYEKNTIVIDPVTGTAYISVQAIPYGVALTNTDYWCVVFDLERFVNKANNNFTLRVEEQTTTTATFNTPLNYWLIWGGVLYRANTNIIAGDRYVVDSNIIRITIADIIGVIQDLNTDDKSNIVAAINEVLTKLADETTARQNADTALQDNIDAVATAEATARQDADNALQGNIDAEATARQDADIALSNKIGNLNDLQTTDKSNSVAAINEVFNHIENLTLYDKADIRNYGGVGDGVTNCTDAFNLCMADNGFVYLPIYDDYDGYLFNELTLNQNQSVIGDGYGTKIIYNGTGDLFTIKGGYVAIENLIISAPNSNYFIHLNNANMTSYEYFKLKNILSDDASGGLIYDDDGAHIYTNMYLDNITLRNVGNVSNATVDLKAAFAFIFLNNVTSVNLTRHANCAHFSFKNNQGLHLTHCEAEGGATDGTHSKNSGFLFESCVAVWLDRCMSDYVDWVGINIDSSSSYFYCTDCSFGGTYANAIIGGDSVKFENCNFIGQKSSDVVLAGAQGIYNFGTKNLVVNCEITNVTGAGVNVSSGLLQLVNSYIHNNGFGIAVNAGAKLLADNNVIIDNDTNESVQGALLEGNYINNKPNKLMPLISPDVPKIGSFYFDTTNNSIAVYTSAGWKSVALI